MKKLILTALALATTVVALQTSAPSAQATPGDCTTVRCAGCDPGYHLRLEWPNCCQCIKD
jgi:hypothetical protein